MDVKNKVCIVTGSAQGLGKAFSKILLDHGARVCISDMKEEAATMTLEEFQNNYGEENVCFVSVIIRMIHLKTLMKKAIGVVKIVKTLHVWANLI